MTKTLELKAAVEELLTRRDVARLLRVSVRSVVNYENGGFLKPVRIGGLVRFTQASLREMLARRTAPRHGRK